MDRLETGWRCRRRRNEGLAPVREEIGSKRVRPKSGRYFPAVGVLLSDPALGSRAEKGNGASRLASDGWELASLPPLRGKDRMGGRAMPARLASLAWEALRRNATNAERRLWRGLRRKEVGDFRFRRQVALGGFIADFEAGRGGKPAADWGRPQSNRCLLGSYRSAEQHFFPFIRP